MSLSTPPKATKAEKAKPSASTPKNTTTTPRKRTAKANKAADDAGEGTPAKKIKVAKDDSTEDGPSDATPKSTRKNKTPTAIPASLEEAGEVYKAVMRMKDEEGATWGDLVKYYEATTGEQIKQSTLRMRYTKIKESIVVWKDGDEELLMAAKAEVEANLEAIKWPKIGEMMVAKGGDKYSKDAMQKKAKQIQSRGTATLPGPSSPAVSSTLAGSALSTPSKGKGKAAVAKINEPVHTDDVEGNGFEESFMGEGQAILEELAFKEYTMEDAADDSI